MFCGTEHDDVPMLRLITSARQLPPAVAMPDVAHLVLFTDGPARHSSIPAARLTYWGVIRAVVLDETAWVSMCIRQKTLAFQAVAMGATPGAQTVPRAELSAVSWVAGWLQAHPGVTAEVHSDCQYVVDLCCRLAAADPADSLLSLPNSDLFLPLVGMRRLQVFKVKAHNPEGVLPHAAARLQWLTAGNEAADALARAARQQEWDLVQRLSDTVAEHCLHEKHHMMLSPGIWSRLTCWSPL